MTARDGQGPDGAVAVLVGLGLAEPDVQAVEPVQAEVPAGQADEFATPERAGGPQQQQRRITALEHLVRPAGAVGAGGVDDGDDVGGQQWGSRAAGAVPGGGVVAADPGQGGPHQIIGGGTGVPGLPVVVGDRRDIVPQRRRRVRAPAVGVRVSAVATR